MAHSNGRIFITTTGGVTYGVEIADLQQVLGRGVNDLGLLCSDQEWYDNNGTPALRPANKINKWARYKPINSNNIGFVTDAERRAANFGLSASQYTAPGPAALAGWSYVRPTAHFRLVDFVKVSDAGVPLPDIGYTSEDVAPCRGFYAGADTNQLTLYQYFTNQNNQNAVTFYAITTGSDWGIGFAEMSALASWYLCIAVDVVRNNTTTTYMVTASQNIGAGVSDPTVTGWQTVTIPTDSSVFLGEATYQAYAVLANKSKSSWYNVASDSSLRFMPIPVQSEATPTQDPITFFQWHVNVGSFNTWVSSAWRQTSGAIADRRKVWYYLWGRNTTSETIPAASHTVYVELVSAANPEDVESATALASVTYSAMSNPTSAIPPTSDSGTLLDGDGDDVYIGYQSLPSLQSGTIYLRVRGLVDGVQTYSSFTPVADGLIPPDPGPRD